MRHAHGQSVLENDKGEIYALNLGADFCAEHEWGINPLRQTMGLGEEEKLKDGLAHYSAKIKGDKNFLTFVSEGNRYIIFDPHLSWESKDEMKKHYAKGGGELYLSSGWKDHPADDFSGSWCGSAFGIIISKDAPEKLKRFADTLVNAISAGDFAVWFGGNDKGNPFRRSGLVVAITSLVPKEIDDYMVEQHKEVKRLKKSSEKTGIIAYLKKKDKRYFACSPRFVEDGKTVQYWLNPMQQDIHNFGWFSAEELKAWADGVAGNKIDKVEKPVKMKV